MIKNLLNINAADGLRNKNKTKVDEPEKKDEI